MQTSTLHTLKSLLTEGIQLEGAEKPLQISCIYIPKIQRAYAQGRESETDIRKDFLDTLFEVLTSKGDKDIELSFLFGSKQVFAKRTGSCFELLDGQQRTTTLFLLYWYLGMKEIGSVPDFLSKFTYDTRDTSTQFIANITSKESKIDISCDKPSVAIKGNKWFTDEYYCDPTVCAMLNMLDSIDYQYKNRSCSSLLEKMERLRFYVLMLEKFDMNDELYIKMNSRGLSLIPFENFKASVVKFMKSEGKYGSDKVIDGVTPYWFEFISKMDATWIDIFWKYDNQSSEECSQIIKIDDKQIGVRYFNFINRYLFTKSCIVDKLENNKLNSLSSFFYNDVETDKMKNRLFGWDKYEMLFSSNDYFHKLGCVLDEFHRNQELIKEAINQDSYGKIKGFDICNEKITLPQRVIFAAITEFIEAIPEDKELTSAEIITNFKRMLRVVFNIIENTSIENPEPTARLIKAVSEIINAPGAVTNNFYESLSSNQFSSRNQQLREEIIKAEEMFSNDEKKEFDPSWEDAFVEAENHPFFKGSILFFFTPRAGKSSAFRDRYNIVKDLFDGNGITKPYRENHLLIRAMIGRINCWSKGLEGRYITENQESQNYLKMLLTNYENVRNLFCAFFGEENQITDMKEYLAKSIELSCPADKESKEFSLLFKRLVNDSHASELFDWISKREREQKKQFCIQNNRNCYLINIPGTWYDRMILDTERHLIIPDLTNKYSMKYENQNQENMMISNVKDSWGWSISISKEIVNAFSKFKLQLDFNEWKYVDFFVYCDDTNLIASSFDVSPEKKQTDKVLVHSMYYQMFEDISKIESEITRICDKLSNLL